MQHLKTYHELLELIKDYLNNVHFHISHMDRSHQVSLTYTKDMLDNTNALLLSIGEKLSQYPPSLNKQHQSELAKTRQYYHDLRKLHAEISQWRIAILNKPSLPFWKRLRFLFLSKR